MLQLLPLLEFSPHSCSPLPCMRVTFISSSLEPGRDGVGDYTRRLADRLVIQGHCVQLIAINDRHATREADDGSRGGGVIRISALVPWVDRLARARAGIEAFGPEWISVQFVPYGFDSRGLVWRLGEHLRALAGSTPIHLMFHELWIGEGGGAALRRRLEGRLQRRLILRMVRELRPSVVQAQASPYVAMLRLNGIAATRLPLFGNIPFSHSTDRSWLRDALQSAGMPMLLERRQDFWLFGLFGTLHPEWTPEPLLSRIRSAATAHHKQPVLMAMGRLGAAGDRIWSDLGRIHADIPRVAIGEQPPERISQALQTLDFGITASPLALVGKSGTVAAMLDHGLPVIVSRNDVSFVSDRDAVETRQPLVIPLAADLGDRLANTRRQPPGDSVDAVAREWLARLEASRPCAS
jgi:hypothetical protein